MARLYRRAASPHREVAHDEPAGPTAGWRLQLLIESRFDGRDGNVPVHALAGHQRIGHVLSNIGNDPAPGTFFLDVGTILIQAHLQRSMQPALGDPHTDHLDGRFVALCSVRDEQFIHGGSRKTGCRIVAHIHAWRGSTREPVSPPRRCTWRCRTYAAPGASPVRTGRPPTPTDPDRGRTPAGAGRHPHTCRNQAASDTFTSRRARTAAAKRSSTSTVVSQSMQPSVMLWP